jgi:hypothetical protein
MVLNLIENQKSTKTVAFISIYYNKKKTVLLNDKIL